MAVWSVCGWGMCLLILRMVVCSVEWRLCSQSVEWRFTVQSPSPRYFKGHVEGICIPPQWAVWDDGAYRVVLGVDQSRWGQATSTAHRQETVLFALTTGIGNSNAARRLSSDVTPSTISN